MVVEYLYNQAFSAISSNNKNIDKSIKENSKLVSRSCSSKNIKNRNENITIDEVLPETKDRILNWLGSIGLIRQNVANLLEKLPKICKNGVLFIDLINRLNGKNEILKGIFREPKQNSHFEINFRKLFEFLADLPKFNPRYLWLSSSLILENEDVFWGLLDDIWHYYNNKLSRYDGRRPEKNSNDNIKENVELPKDQSKTRIYGSTFGKKFLKNNNKSLILNKSVLNNPDFDDVLTQAAPNQTVLDSSFLRNNVKDSYSNIHSKNNQKDQLNKSYNLSSKKAENFSKLKDNNNNFVHKKDLGRTSFNALVKAINDDFPSQKKFILSSEIEVEINDWLVELGFRTFLLNSENSIIENCKTNGILLVLVLKKLGFEMEFVNNVRSIQDCRYNWNLCKKIIEAKKIEVPSLFFKDIDELIYKNHESLYGILFYLKNYILKMEDLKRLDPILLTEKGENMNIPYSNYETSNLIENLKIWLRNENISDDLYMDDRVFEIIYKLVQKVDMMEKRQSNTTDYKKIFFHHSHYSQKHNLSKALDILRKNQKIGRKFLWKEKEILNLNRECILGLLEDIYRFFNGKPGRYGNDNYFVDGPLYTIDDGLIRGSKQLNKTGNYVEKNGIFSFMVERKEE